MRYGFVVLTPKSILRLVALGSGNPAGVAELAIAHESLTVAQACLASARTALGHARSWITVAQNRGWFIATEGVRNAQA